MSKSNPWKYAQVDPARVKDNRFLNPRTPRTPPPPLTPPPGLNPKIEGDYILMPQTGTYALGVHALQEACKAENNTAHPQFTRNNGSRIYRPLTFRENIQARVDDFNRLTDSNGDNRSLDDRLKLFDKWLDSCMGVTHKAKSKKFKLVEECSQLIEIPKDFSEGFLPIAYRRIQGVELNSGKTGVKYDKLLTENEVDDHEAWINAIGDNQAGRNLLREYTGIVFSQLKRKYNREKGMRFWVLQNTDKDQLRSLCVYNLDSNSNASGGNYLDDDGSFLRVAQPKTP